MYHNVTSTHLLNILSCFSQVESTVIQLEMYMGASAKFSPSTFPHSFKPPLPHPGENFAHIFFPPEMILLLLLKFLIPTCSSQPSLCSRF